MTDTKQRRALHALGNCSAASSYIAALPKRILSLLFIPVTVYSCRVIFMNMITTLLQQKVNL